LIAGITQQVMDGYAVDPRRVFVAGLSAGGAEAAILGVIYPKLYASIGVHSGLPYGAAHDVRSAFAAMQRGTATPTRAASRLVPTIIFHGDRDKTVNKLNADSVAAQAAQGAALSTHTEQGEVPGGHAFDRTLHTDSAGHTVIEQWTIRGGGHAWFGGSPAGTYTDARGPDATREMLRFFLEHPQAS
jgi:poly(3-hydroxybutyrate) depolymerase